MKKTFLLTFLTALEFIAFSQSHEFDLNYRFGIATNSYSVLKPDNFTRYNYRKIQSVYDQGISCIYKFQIWPRFKLFLSAGIDSSQSYHYQPIYSSEGPPRHLDNIYIRSNRLSIHYFGLNKQFSFFENRLILDIGWHPVYRFYSEKSQNYSSEFKSNNEDWIKYKYNLTTYYPSDYYDNDANITVPNIYYNADYNLHLKILLKKNIYLNFGFNYSRNNVFFYDYTYSINYYAGGSTTPTSTYDFLGLSGNFDPKYGIKDHYVYFNAGITYKPEKLFRK